MICNQETRGPHQHIGETQLVMYVTLFTDLPDLVILDVLRYLSPFDAIQAFYDVDNNDTDRIINLLIEGECFSSIHHLRLPLFHFVCDYVIPRIGRKLSHLTLYDYQLALARRKDILSNLSNISSLHLLNITEITENDLSYFLHQQIQTLTIEFLSEHHIEAQAYICEQFIFDQCSVNLINCHLMNIYGIQLKHLNLFPNSSIENLTIQLKELTDLHVLFDHLSNIKILNVEICRWTIEEIKYDYKQLSNKLPYLQEFSLRTQHALSFDQMLIIIKNLIYLKKLSFIYRNYDEHGIDINQLELTLNHLSHLIQLDFIIKFIYFNLNPKLTFENNISFKERWNIQTYIKPSSKNYLAYTEPFRNRDYSISSDVFQTDQLNYFPSVINLSLTIHTKQYSFSPILRSLNHHFPSITHLHIIDSFGIEDNNEENLQLPRIHSLDATDMKISNLFDNLLQSMPNLNYLQINSSLLNDCDRKLLTRNHIKHLELITNDFNQINELLLHFPGLEHLIINSKKQSTRSERKFYQIILQWFEICSQLYTIHIKAHKLSDLFYLINIQTDENIHIQYSNEIFTVWK